MGGKRPGGKRLGGKRHGGQKVRGQKTGGQNTGGQKTGGQKTGGQKSCHRWRVVVTVQCSALVYGLATYYGEYGATHCIHGFGDLHKLFLTTVP